MRRAARATEVVRPAETALAFADFLGSWAVRRVIIDHLSGVTHHFIGTVIISASAFVETGMVRYGAQSLKANRCYNLEMTMKGLDIAFPDGRGFISLDGRASQTVRHLCGDDDYRGRLLFADADAWVEAWRVSGPRKRYASLARYRRQEI